MKRGVTKEEIIHATQELIARNGIRAVRVDEIAQTLGISKRTLYEMFTDKNDLVSACLDAMSHQQRERIVACRKRRGGNPLQKVLRLTNELHRQPLYGRPPFPVGHQPQDHLRGALRRAPGILAQGTDRLPRNLSPGTASAARNRRPGICRAVDEHDPRPAPERHGPRGTPALLPDDTPRRGDPEGHRTDRPQTVSFAIRL